MKSAVFPMPGDVVEYRPGCGRLLSDGQSTRCWSPPDHSERGMDPADVELSGLERDFLILLSSGTWTSPLVFDHALIGRLVEAGFVGRRALPSGEVDIA